MIVTYSRHNIFIVQAKDVHMPSLARVSSPVAKGN